MTDKEIINNEKYHTCGRCKYETTPDDKYPCIACTHGTDHRTDLWELEQESEYEHDHDVVKAYNDGQAYILDKIRSEIEETVKTEANQDKKWASGLRYSLKIIDKYKDGE